MGTVAKVGRSLNYDSAVAAREAATAALTEVAGGAASVAVVFATAGHDQDAIVAGVRETLGANVLMTGCSAEGIITEAGSEECSHAVAVMLITSDELTFHTYSVADFGDRSAAAGTTLAGALKPNLTEGGLLLLFPDGVRGNCRELIDALEEQLDPMPQIAGGTAGDMLRMERTFQYHDGEVHTDSLSALLINGRFEAEIVASHGFEVVGAARTVTRAEDCHVYEIDGEPAWSLFKSYLPGDADTLDAAHIAHLSLAERIDAEPTDDFGRFVVRVPMTLDADLGALYFAAGLTTGTEVQLALRNTHKVTEHAIAMAKRLVSRRQREPMLVLQLDCAGRGRLLFDDRASDQMVHPIREVIGEGVPWIGLHTYGEIAPVGDRTYFHNHTGVVCALYATPES